VYKRQAERQQTINVTRDTSRAALTVMLRSIFGDDYARVELPFAILSEDAARSMTFAQGFRKLGRLVLDIIADRRRKGSTPADMLGLLMQARDRGRGQPLTDRELLSEITTLIVAGHETTASTLNWAWYLLSTHPEVENKLADELARLAAGMAPAAADLARFAYTRQVIEETMRLYPAGWLMTRRAFGDDRLGDYFVPAGTEIYIPPYFIQRHPRLWRDPDRFDPDRFAATPVEPRPALAMLPFSAGPRNCIGEPLARLEMQFHLIIIARRLRLKFVPTTPIELDAGVNLRSKGDFVMTPEIRR